MNNTPETDHLEVQLGKAATHSHPILWEHSRKMERERDEAKAGREAYKQLAVKHAQDRDKAREDRENSRQSLAFALEELDEARKEAHRFRSLHYGHLGINASASWFPWEEKSGHE